jgi:hypothetical protein
VDWSAPVEQLRAELRRVCEGSELWNGRVCVLQVTEAVGGMIRLRALVSADDAGALWDLRCVVRERLVTWVFENRPDALPRLRADTDPPRADGPPRPPGEQAAQPPASGPGAVPEPAAGPHGAHRDGDPGATVFSGGADGDARGEKFGGPDPEVSVSSRP